MSTLADSNLLHSASIADYREFNFVLLVSINLFYTVHQLFIGQSKAERNKQKN